MRELLTYVLTIQHPENVHFFRHAIEELEREGHDVHVFCKDVRIIRQLLDHYGIEYEALAGKGGGPFTIAKAQALWEARLLVRAARIRPDVMTGAGGGTAVSHVAPLVGADSVVFTETEHAASHTISLPFADEVWTPECFHRRVPTRHITYPGYQKLAYLHPNRFEPDSKAVEAAGIDPNERYAVLRLSAWDALHDVGQAGLEDHHDVVRRIESTETRAIVIAETAVEADLEPYCVEIEPHQIHDLLAFADVYVGEGASMAIESAVLGTPAVYVNTLRTGPTDEIEARYGLLFNCQGAYRHHNAVETAVGILSGEITRDWHRRREQLLSETCDPTEVILTALRGRSAQS